MHPLESCRKCGGFFPQAAHACPLCESPRPARSLGRRLLAGAITVVGGGALAVTLAACYGSAYEPTDAGATRVCDAPATDTDGDGYCGAFDCDETQPGTHFEATDTVGDGIDQNCDGVDGDSSDAGP